jgi:spore maturation protein CgeB
VLGYIYFPAWVETDTSFIVKNIRHKKIFWNLEDPNHFGLFNHLAAPADIIFTSASELVPTYTAFFNKPTFALPWACCPKMHYPNSADPDFKHRRFDVVFVGNRYPTGMDRLYGEQSVLVPAIQWCKENNKKIGVFGYGNLTPHSWRFFPDVWVDSDENEPYDRLDIDCVNRNPDYHGPYQYHTSAFVAREMYNDSIVALCMNEQLDSPTMTSMRTYEACACGNPIISHWSLATENIFGEFVQMASTPEETREALDYIFKSESDGIIPAEALFAARKGIAEMYEHHTYRHRLLFLLEKLALFA